MNHYRCRIGTINDLPFLKEMLCEAILWNQPENKPSLEELLSRPDLAKILADWGDRKGDLSIVAIDEDHHPVGAVWYRFWARNDHSFGFVDEDVPELGIAIGKECRGKGLGTLLMKKIIDHTRRIGINKMSLSVSPLNVALKLYQKLGFYKVGDYDDAWTIVIDMD
jgi:RimJ/RimL family protein N-acetyltransferase